MGSTVERELSSEISTECVVQETAVCAQPQTRTRRPRSDRSTARAARALTLRAARRSWGSGARRGTASWRWRPSRSSSRRPPVSLDPVVTVSDGFRHRSLGGGVKGWALVAFAFERLWGGWGCWHRSRVEEGREGGRHNNSATQIGTLSIPHQPTPQPPSRATPPGL